MMRVWHYLHLPSTAAAMSLAGRLIAAGYSVEILEVEPEWLIAEHRLLEDQQALEVAAKQLEQLALTQGGEYDGWERETAAGAASATCERSQAQHKRPNLQ